jgi:hypothetical protein
MREHCADFAVLCQIVSCPVPVVRLVVRDDPCVVFDRACALARIDEEVDVRPTKRLFAGMAVDLLGPWIPKPDGVVLVGTGTRPERHVCPVEDAEY